jgi:tRNA (cmo5U34)-methyltransferase
MSMNMDESASQWSEENSQTFIEYGQYFVPAREQQLDTICLLIPPRKNPFNVVELCCGEGRLAGAILERHPASTVFGYDGSLEMMRAAQQRLANYGERFRAQQFNLADGGWRNAAPLAHAVVSSLAIHHLDGRQKQMLFDDVYAMLAPGGVFIVADVILPAHRQGWQVAATAWDQAVQEQALALDGHLRAFAEFQKLGWNMYRTELPDDIDKPSSLFEQLTWLEAAGFVAVDVYWMRAGHAIYGGVRE